MIIFAAPNFFKLMGKGFQGITLFPFIIVKEQKLLENKVLINHEKIHLRQQIELLVVPFYVLYLVHYLINLVKYKKHMQAYHQIIFEKEAYSHEREMDYLVKRKFFGFIKYF